MRLETGGFLYSKEFIPSPRTARSPIQSTQGTPFKDVKRPWGEADHSRPSSDEVESQGSYTSIPQYASIAYIWIIFVYNLTLPSYYVT